jgi:hypothetical protein
MIEAELKESKKDLHGSTSKAIVFNSLQEQLEYTKNSRRRQKIINVPNYPKVFSYIDNGVQLYYFKLYNPIKIVSKLHAIDVLGYGVKIYEKTADGKFKEV